MLKLLLTSICITSFFGSFMGSSINIAIPFISSEYNVSPEKITYMIAAFMICSASFLLPATALANRFSYKKIYILGCLSNAISSILVPLSTQFIFLVLFRGLQGLSAALVFCTGMALLVDNIPKEKRALYIALAVSCVYAGLSFSPIISGIIVDNLSWRVIFYFTACAQFIAFLCALGVKQDKNNTEHINYIKMLLCFVGGLLTLCILPNLSFHIIPISILLLGLILIGIYLYAESKAQYPVFPVSILNSNRLLSYALSASMLNYMASFAISMLLSMHLQLILAISATHTGIILIIQPVLMTIFSPLAGKLSHKFTANTLVIVGMLLSLVATIIFSTLENNSPMYIVYIGQIFAGIGFGLFSAPNTNIVMSSVSRDKYALASALQAMSRTVGMACGVSILTSLLNNIIDADKDSTLYIYELGYAISVSFMISSAILVIGLIFCILSKKESIKFSF